MTALLALLAIGIQEPSCKVTALPAEPEHRPGKPLEVALQFELEPGWHIYWKNPGDSGEPTRIKWNLPKGWSELDLRFPTPRAIDAGGITNYGYEGRVTLIARLKPPQDYNGEAVNFSGEATYLICKDACVPGARKFSFKLPGTAIEEEVWNEVRSAFPIPYPRTIRAAYSEKSLSISVPEKRLSKAYFFSSQESVVAHSLPQTLRKTESGYELNVPLSEYLTSRPKKVAGVLVLTGEDASVRGYNIELTP